MSHAFAVVLLTALLATALAVRAVAAGEIHVAATGSDAGTGSQDSPYLTIGKAAAVAQPGDTVSIHAGTYREWVKPPRGGTGEDQRITYRAAPGEEVLIKGSQRVTSWADQGGGVWQAELPNELFGDYNPFALTLSGGWLEYGKWHHRGDVYLDGEALLETQTPQEVKLAQGTWHGQAGEKTTIVRANFGDAKPNEALAEINVRQCVFFPEKAGLSYITVAGLHLLHSAENWQPPGPETQFGTIGPRGGKHWVIRNCRVTNARCVGIVLGHAAGVNYDDIEAFGDHVVRENLIRRCGQAGIAGQKGATRCLIEGNLIEDTNYRKEFGGWETAAIKFHQSVDTVIRGNLIRRVGHQSHGAFGIWMDWANQGTRITGNIIYETQTANIFVEMDHGAILIDNNVLIGLGVQSNSEGDVFAHNLFVDCAFNMGSDTGRKSEYFRPHTRQTVKTKVGIPQDDKWYNNIFVGRGLDGVKAASGYASDHNVFLGGAKKSTFGDEHSVVVPAGADVTHQDAPMGVTIEFSIGEPLPAAGPWVDGTLVGVLPTIGQTIEDRNGKPIRVETDLTGGQRTAAIPGPLAELKPGRNRILWTKKD
ncbi:MAG: right-handed parallel beta-helix repeat-containing protein [Planctomycetota bacterium]